MAISPETAGVVIASVLALAGVIIAAMLTGKKSSEERSNFNRTCALHSGMEAEIAAIKALLEEVRGDVKHLLERRKEIRE